MTNVKKNKLISSEIMIEGFKGKSIIERKPFYVKRNIFDLDPETPIYRICPFDRFESDLSNGTLTHTRVDPKIWGDSYENPLLNIQFKDSGSEQNFTLGLFKNMFAVCWSLESEENLDRWNEFSRGKPGIRIQTTVGRLLDRVMRSEDPFFMLHHYIGKVTYESQSALELWRNDSDYTKHLDTLGQGIAMAVMRLRTHFAGEQEARLIYSHMPTNNSWITENVHVIGNECKLPFVWDDLISTIIVAPNFEDGGEETVRKTLKKAGISCFVSSSNLRRYVG